MASYGAGDIAVVIIIVCLGLYRILGSAVAVAILFAFAAVQLQACYAASTLWQRLGVPSAPAWFYLGHIIEYRKKGINQCDVEWMQKFGKVFGAYAFAQPEIMIADSELLKKVLAQDFDNFPNRRKREFPKKEIVSRTILQLRDEEWKNTRNAITPAFTSKKLKGVVHVIDSCVDMLCLILSEQNDNQKGIDVNEIMTNLTMDVIANTAFAMTIDAQRNPGNEFIKHAKAFSNIDAKSWRYAFARFFPFSLNTLDNLFGFHTFISELQDFYVANLTKVIKDRRETENEKQLDFLQLLINAADKKKHDLATDPRNEKWALTDQDIIAQCFLFLFAGQETSSVTLTFACYLLALHADVQEKCWKEIDDLIKTNRTIAYDHVQSNMPYLDAVVSETLRLFPPAVRFERHCESDYQLTDHVLIPKGVTVCVPVYAIQHSPENYKDPELFDPERFLVESKRNNDPFAYMPFGYGLRNCIGKRFALFEIKLVLTNVLRKFRIEPCSTTQAMPLQLSTVTLLKAKTPIRLRFLKR